MADNKRTCSIPECGKPHVARGWCNKHWIRWTKTGSTDLMPKPSLTDRFWAKVDKRGPAECWPWTGATNKKGYGKLLSSGRLIGAHVVSYELHHGVLADGLEVDHECHNILCVNPSHLRQATRKQNSEYLNGSQANNKLGVRGVAYDPERRKYMASVNHNGRQSLHMRFDTLEEADAAVRAKRAELFTFPEVV